MALGFRLRPTPASIQALAARVSTETMVLVWGIPHAEDPRMSGDVSGTLILDVPGQG